MTRIWQLGDLEFVVLWEQLNSDYLPFPFSFMSRTPLYDDFLREKRETAERVRTRLSGSFDSVLESVAQPDIRIIVDAWDGRDPQRSDGRIRIMATRKGSQGFLVTQLPGETYMHSGGFTVAECDPLRLADEIVSALPVSKPGDHAEIPLSPPSEKQDDIDYEYGRSRIGAGPEDPVADRSRKFLHIRPTLIGTIDVIQGSSVFGPRGVTRHRMEWRDLQDSGRYVIGHAAPWKAVAADEKRFIGMINARIAEVIRVIKEERR
ncbi:ESX secretion-associated protein EspG [Nocardia sp. NBC_01503]|uniref:ESX secretion-associated protein EspG n=1 Tax=Nocardia sp. NBC_01503 TaxID=2975997 RepID=UPI002E7B9141|nr:ESX secretion-associated protein EspG [Nocardia sp. NBC_01503]WTL33920.1 ESX secretion-associated protein EspG [Nocardia sp. NBC_01503]